VNIPNRYPTPSKPLIYRTGDKIMNASQRAERHLRTQLKREGLGGEITSLKSGGDGKTANGNVEKYFVIEQERWLHPRVFCVTVYSNSCRLQEM